jgi:hypothetical protein
LFFCRSTLHTTFNDQHDKEAGGRRRNATEMQLPTTTSRDRRVQLKKLEDAASRICH